jgi:hypothetical protein
MGWNDDNILAEMTTDERGGRMLDSWNFGVKQRW